MQAARLFECLDADVGGVYHSDLHALLQAVVLNDAVDAVVTCPAVKFYLVVGVYNELLQRSVTAHVRHTLNIGFRLVGEKEKVYFAGGLLVDEPAQSL